MTSTIILSDDYQAPELTPTTVIDQLTIHYNDGDVEKLGVTAVEIDLTDASFVITPGRLFTADEFIDNLLILEDESIDIELEY